MLMLFLPNSSVLVQECYNPVLSVFSVVPNAECCMHEDCCYRVADLGGTILKYDQNNVENGHKKKFEPVPVFEESSPMGPPWVPVTSWYVLVPVTEVRKKEC